MKKLLRLAQSPLIYLSMGIILFTACNKEPEETPRPESDVLEVIDDTDGLDSLSAILENYSGLEETFTNGEFTIFAPSDAAFREMLEQMGLETLSEINSSTLASIILYHVVANNMLNQNQINVEADLTTLAAEQITFDQEDSLVLNLDTQTDRTTIVTPNIQASNGVIHVINHVLLPPDIATTIAPTFGTLAGYTNLLSFGGSNGEGNLTTINAVFNYASLNTRLSSSGTYTVLAPIDQAWDYFYFTSNQNITDVANYHILEGNVDFSNAGRTIATLGGENIYVTNYEGTTFLNGIPFLDFGYTASNGKMLFSGFSTSFPRGVLKPAVPLTEMLDYYEGLTGASLSIFRLALEQSGITVGQNKTILIPTDEAFEAAGIVTSLDSATVARLDPEYLSNILSNHILTGLNFSSDIFANAPVNATSLSETSVNIAYDDENGVTISSGATTGAQLVYPDGLTDNGVTHLIDQVLIP